MEHQDWRYTMYKTNHPELWQLINLFGIHLMPTIVVYVALIPAGYVILVGSTVANLLLVGLGFIICVTVATIQFALVNQ
jgi:hypothetical protein